MSEHSTESDTSTAADGPSATKKAKDLSKILGKHLPSTTTLGLSPQEMIKQELDSYLGHPQVEMEEDPLNLWRVEHPRYPHLTKLAQKYLCIYATAERFFIFGGQLVSDRSALKPERVDQLVFLEQISNKKVSVRFLISCRFLHTHLSWYTVEPPKRDHFERRPLFTLWSLSSSQRLPNICFVYPLI